MEQRQELMLAGAGPAESAGAGPTCFCSLPPQSPDLNIIEAVWDHLDRERNKGQPQPKEELKEVLKEA